MNEDYDFGVAAIATGTTDRPNPDTVRMDWLEAQGIRRPVAQDCYEALQYDGETLRDAIDRLMREDGQCFPH